MPPLLLRVRSIRLERKTILGECDMISARERGDGRQRQIETEVKEVVIIGQRRQMFVMKDAHTERFFLFYLVHLRCTS